jgi:hypothetical protein
MLFRSWDLLIGKLLIRTVVVIRFPLLSGLPLGRFACLRIVWGWICERDLSHFGWWFTSANCTFKVIIGMRLVFYRHFLSRSRFFSRMNIIYSFLCVLRHFPRIWVWVTSTEVPLFFIDSNFHVRALFVQMYYLFLPIYF